MDHCMQQYCHGYTRAEEIIELRLYISSIHITLTLQKKTVGLLQPRLIWVTSVECLVMLRALRNAACFLQKMSNQ